MVGAGARIAGKEVTITGGNVSPTKIPTNANGEAGPFTVTAGTSTGVTALAIKVGTSPFISTTTYVHMYRSTLPPLPYVDFDFNSVIPQGEFEAVPPSLSTARGIEQWLDISHYSNVSPLAWRGYGATNDWNTQFVLADPVDDLPSSGVIRFGKADGTNLDNEEIAYSSKDPTYPPRLTGIRRGDVPQDHNLQNAAQYIYLKTTLAEDIMSVQTFIPLVSVQGARISLGGVGIVIIGSEVITFSGVDTVNNLLTGCIRGSAKAPHKRDDVVYYEAASAGTLVSTIVHHECLTPDDHGQILNPEVVLAQFQKEHMLISIPLSGNPTDDDCRLDCALGYAMVNGSKSCAICRQDAYANIKKEIELSVGRTKELYRLAKADYKWEINNNQPDWGVQYWEATWNRAVSVRFKVSSKEAHVLYQYTPWIQDRPNDGGNWLFAQIWHRLGF